jgi:hypothetical protein
MRLGPLSEYWGPEIPLWIEAPKSGFVVVRSWLKQSHHFWTVDLQCNCCCCIVHAVEVDRTLQS